jgi:cyanate lyase
LALLPSNFPCGASINALKFEVYLQKENQKGGQRIAAIIEGKL